MKNRKLLFILTLLMLQYSCSQQKHIDEIIAKYDTTNFSDLKDRSVSFRSKGTTRKSSIYFVSTYETSCSPYVVEVNNDDKSIIEIKNHLVLKSCDKDYLSRQEIEVVVKTFLKYGLPSIQVDTEGNVYINPYVQESPILLRKAPNSIPEDLSRFEVYKGNWYVSK